ncbi:MAG: CPBP family glutamic-type intramembrane protease [Eubacteriales bacterium]
MTITTKKPQYSVLAILIFGCVVLAYLDGFAHPPFWTKSAIKVLLFVGIPLGYSYFTKDPFYRPLFALDKKALALAMGLGFGVIAVILGAFFALGELLDLSAVVGELESAMAVTAENFIAVALYIAIFNSFFEEFFFRGFAFFQLKKYYSRTTAHVISSTLFSLYHVAIIAFWFDLWVFVLCLVGLVVGGVIFNLLDESTHSIYPSWLTHACANLALNSIGMMLFYGN